MKYSDGANTFLVVHGRSQDFSKDGFTESYRGYSPDCHLNIVGCLLTKRLTKGGGVTCTLGRPGYNLAGGMNFYRVYKDVSKEIQFILVSETVV